jgi:cytochrome P450
MSHSPYGARFSGPPWHHVPRLFFRIRRDPIVELGKLRDVYGDSIRIRFGSTHLFVLSHPDAIRHVLVDEQERYSKRTMDYQAMKPVLGEGLLTSEGALWRRQRRTINPAFRHSELSRFITEMTRETEDVLDSLRATAGNHAVDIAREMTRLALNVVTKTLFRADPSERVDQISRAVTLLNQHMAEDATLLFALPHFVPTNRNRRFLAARRTVDRHLYGLVKDRDSAAPGDGIDLLNLLRSARDPETNEAMSERQLRDEVVTLIAAGHETTANALAWTFYLLSRHPEVAEAVRAEVDSVLNGRVPNLQDLGELRLTKRVLQESMRLYPPAWGLSRRAERADEIGGEPVPAGSLVQILVYFVHRHPDFWEQPERFDPDRFLPGAVELRHRFAYVPFSAGARICIGRDFALMEAQIVLAMVMQRYRFVLAEGHPVELEPIITLRPRYGIWLKLEERL